MYKFVLDITDDDIDEEERSFGEVWPVSEINKKFEHKTLDMTNFKLPNHFGFTIDNKLKKSSASFDNNDYNSICRILANSIEEFTIHPDPNSIRFLVGQLIGKYPAIVIDEENKVTTLVSEKNLNLGMKFLKCDQFSYSSDHVVFENEEDF